MNASIEQKARELLAAEYERDGDNLISVWVRRGEWDKTPGYRAIVRALTPTGENAKHVEVLRVMLNEDASRLNLQAYEREAIDAAIRALSAPDNAEAVDLLAGVKRYSHELVGSYIHWEVRTHESQQGEWCRYSDVWACVSLPLVTANPTPAARVSVSDEDLVLAEEAASYLHDHASFKKMNATRWAGGIYRLVQAVKREG